MTRNEQVTRKLGLALFIDRKIVQLKMTAAATNASCLNSTQLSEILENLIKQTRLKLKTLLNRKKILQVKSVFVSYFLRTHSERITSSATIFERSSSQDGPSLHDFDLSIRKFIS